MTLWWRRKRYRLASILHALRDPTPLGSPLLGKDRLTRNKNIRLMTERWWAKAPRPEDYGLPAESKEQST